MSNYVVYHAHSMFSNGTTNVDSITDFHAYVDRAKELGMKAMAFSEHGNIFAWKKKKDYIEECGMKYIHAVEAYITEDCGETDEDGKYIKNRDNYHTVLIAKNYDGVREINKLVSRSHNRKDYHFYYMPRITLNELIQTSDNIIVTSACLAGILNCGTPTAKEKFLSFAQENKGRCFLEIQHHNCEQQIKYNKLLYDVSKETGIRLIVGTDTHALNNEHLDGRSMLQLGKGVYFEGEDDWDLSFKSYDELVTAYKQQNSLPMDIVLDAINNTNVMSDMVEEFTLDCNTKYPKIYDNPLQTYKDKINEAYKKHPYIRKRYKPKEIHSMIKEEVDVYEKTKSIDFMLLQTYLREWENKNDIHCGYGRGSVSGSEVAYILGITQMDSKKFGLNFFRFMNPSRVTNADIDTDYSSDDRDRVKEFILKEHMGLPNINASEIVTFNTIAKKGAIRDICRAFHVDNLRHLPEDVREEIEAFEKKSKEKSPLPKRLEEQYKKYSVHKEVPYKYMKLSDEMSSLLEFNEDGLRKKYKDIFKYVDLVNGVVVSVGSHPSGILVSDLDIESEIGMCSLSSSEYPVSMLNMKELDSLMYVKLDALSLDNIGSINDTCKLAEIERLTPDNVDLDDEAVWKDIRDDTTMIFQWESESAQAYLKRLMSDETIEIAKNHVEDFSYIKWFSFGNGLIRPGCASFRDSVANGEIVTTGFKELDDFLSITFGRIVMQEDIMKFLVNFCGYSDAESDNVRRLIAKKYGTESAIEEIHDRFLSYSHEKYNMPIDKLEEIFPPIKQGILDATGYAFSWNHSDAYSCIGYICGYLRYYYPLEFVTASLNIFEGKEDKTIAIIDYAKKKGFTISPIRFRKSRAKYGFDKKSNQILKGISSIKYMNATIADELYALKDNKYDSFIDLLHDIKKNTSVNSKQLNILIELDYFKEFGDINKLLSDVEVFDAFAERKQLRKAELDDMNIDYDVIRNIGCKETEKMFKDFDSIKLAKYISSNKVVRHRTLKEKIESQIEHLGYVNISDEEYSGMGVVLSVDTRYSPRLKVHSLRYGNVVDCKVEKKIFNKNKLQYKDIIRISKSHREPKKKKCEDGSFVPIPNTSEIWLTKYNILKI